MIEGVAHSYSRGGRDPRVNTEGMRIGGNHSLLRHKANALSSSYLPTCLDEGGAERGASYTDQWRGRK